MSFWGPSDTMKEAQGFPREMGAWSFQQFKDALNRMQNEGYRADDLNRFGKDYWMNLAAFGTGDPEYVKGMGQWISPGVQGALDSRRQRLNQIGGDFDATQGRVGERLDAQGVDDSNVEGYNTSDINDTYKRMSDKMDASSSDIVNNIRDSYGSARTNAGNAYGGMRRQAGQTYDRIGADADAAYSEAEQTLERLKPGGDLQAARVGRSFAPMVANTMRNLRATGVDPASGEASNLLNRVQGARARAMDDAAADSVDKYVTGKNNLTLGRFDTKSGIQREGLNTDLSLNREGSGIDRDLTLGEGADFRNEIGRTQDISNQINQGWMTDTITNRGAGADRRAQLRNNQNNFDYMGWDTRANLGREQNAEDANAVEAQYQQFQRGQNFINNDTSQRNQAAGTLTNMAGQANGAALGWGQLARGFGGDAANNYAQSWQYEAPNAGWGTKLLTGVAGAGLNALFPGAGTLTQGLATGATGSNPWGGGTSPWGGGRNPWVMN